MKLATWNINSLTVRLSQGLDWPVTDPVDVLALQESKMTDDKFPHEAFTQAGYFAQWFGQRTYNGVASITRTPAMNVVVTRQPSWQADGALRANSLEEAASLCPSHADVWVLGGAEIYAQALPMARTAVVTEVDADFVGDTYAPQCGAAWTKTEGASQVSSTGTRFSFSTYHNTIGD